MQQFNQARNDFPNGFLVAASEVPSKTKMLVGVIGIGALAHLAEHFRQIVRHEAKMIRVGII